MNDELLQLLQNGFDEGKSENQLFVLGINNGFSYNEVTRALKSFSKKKVQTQQPPQATPITDFGWGNVGLDSSYDQKADIFINDPSQIEKSLTEDISGADDLGKFVQSSAPNNKPQETNDNEYRHVLVSDDWFVNRDDWLGQTARWYNNFVATGLAIGAKEDLLDGDPENNIDAAERLAYYNELQEKYRSERDPLTWASFGTVPGVTNVVLPELLGNFFSSVVAGFSSEGALETVVAGVAEGQAVGVASGLAGGPLAEITVPAGYLIGTGVGLATGTAYAGSYALEMSEAISMAMEELHIDTTDPEEIAKTFESEEGLKKIHDAMERRKVRAAIIASVDALLAGAGGTTARAVRKAGGSVMKAAGAEILVDATGGALGETAGQIAEEGEVTSGLDIVMEALGGPVMAAPAAATRAVSSRYNELMTPTSERTYVQWAQKNKANGSSITTAASLMGDGQVQVVEQKIQETKDQLKKVRGKEAKQTLKDDLKEFRNKKYEMLNANIRAFEELTQDQQVDLIDKSQKIFSLQQEMREATDTKLKSRLGAEIVTLMDNFGVFEVEEVAPAIDPIDMDQLATPVVPTEARSVAEGASTVDPITINTLEDGTEVIAERPIDGTEVQGTLRLEGTPENPTLVVETETEKVELGQRSEVDPSTIRMFEPAIAERQTLAVQEDGTFLYQKPDNPNIAEGTRLSIDPEVGVNAISIFGGGQFVPLETPTAISAEAERGVRVQMKDESGAVVELYGQDAMDAAYQILLSARENPSDRAKVNQIIESNETARQAIEQAEREFAAEQTAERSIPEVDEPAATEAQPSVEPAPRPAQRVAPSAAEEAASSLEQAREASEEIDNSIEIRGGAVNPKRHGVTPRIAKMLNSAYNAFTDKYTEAPRVIIHRTKQSLQRATGGPYEAFYEHEREGGPAIHVMFNATTAAIREEFAHAGLRNIMVLEPRVRTSLYNDLQSINNESLRQKMDERFNDYVTFYIERGHSEQHAIAVAEEEVIVGIIADINDNLNQLDATFKGKSRRAINKILSGKLSSFKLKSENELVNLVERVTQGYRSGQKIYILDIAKRIKENPNNNPGKAMRQERDANDGDRARLVDFALDRNLDLSEMKVLGSGAFGYAFLVKDASGNNVVVKEAQSITETIASAVYVREFNGNLPGLAEYYDVAVSATGKTEPLIYQIKELVPTIMTAEEGSTVTPLEIGEIINNFLREYIGSDSTIPGAVSESMYTYLADIIESGARAFTEINFPDDYSEVYDSTIPFTKLEMFDLALAYLDNAYQMSESLEKIGFIAPDVHYGNIGFAQPQSTDKFQKYSQYKLFDIDGQLVNHMKRFDDLEPTEHQARVVKIYRDNIKTASANIREESSTDVFYSDGPSENKFSAKYFYEQAGLDIITPTMIKSILDAEGVSISDAESVGEPGSDAIRKILDTLGVVNLMHSEQDNRFMRVIHNRLFFVDESTSSKAFRLAVNGDDFIDYRGRVNEKIQEIINEYRVESAQSAEQKSTPTTANRARLEEYMLSQGMAISKVRRLGDGAYGVAYEVETLDGKTVVKQTRSLRESQISAIYLNKYNGKLPGLSKYHGMGAMFLDAADTFLGAASHVFVTKDYVDIKTDKFDRGVDVTAQDIYKLIVRAIHDVYDKSFSLVETIGPSPGDIYQNAIDIAKTENVALHLLAVMQDEEASRALNDILEKDGFTRSADNPIGRAERDGRMTIDDLVGYAMNIWQITGSMAKLGIAAPDLHDFNVGFSKTQTTLNGFPMFEVFDIDGQQRNHMLMGNESTIARNLFFKNEVSEGTKNKFIPQYATIKDEAIITQHDVLHKPKDVYDLREDLRLPDVSPYSIEVDPARDLVTQSGYGIQIPYVDGTSLFAAYRDNSSIPFSAGVIAEELTKNIDEAGLKDMISRFETPVFEPERVQTRFQGIFEQRAKQEAEILQSLKDKLDYMQNGNRARLDDKIVAQAVDKVGAGSRVSPARNTSASADNTTNFDGSRQITMEYTREFAPKVYVRGAYILSTHTFMSDIKDAKKLDIKREPTDAEITRADEIYKTFVDRATRNLIKLHDSFSEDVRKYSKLWYVGANLTAQDLAVRYGYTQEQAAGILAALSPQKDWYQNIALGESVMRVMSSQKDTEFSKSMYNTALRNMRKVKNKILNQQDFKRKATKEAYKSYLKRKAVLQGMVGKSLREIIEGDNAALESAMFVRTYNEMFEDRNYHIVSPIGERIGYGKKANGEMKTMAWGSYAEISSATSIAIDGTMENIDSKVGDQHKVRSFFNNINDPNSDTGDVTIDTHAVAAAELLPLSGSDAEVFHNFGGGTAAIDVKAGSSNLGIKGVYFAYAEAYRNAAEQKGLLAREMQSITWEAVRTLFTPGFKAQKKNKSDVRAIWQEYADGNISFDEAQDQVFERAGGIFYPDWYVDSGDRARLETKERRHARKIFKSLDPNVPFEASIRKDLAEDMSRFYEPQKIDQIKSELETMSIEELLAEMKDIAISDGDNPSVINDAMSSLAGGDFRVLATLEYLKRLQNQGKTKEYRAVLKRFFETGTAVGQLLRQFAEVKGQTPAGMKDLVDNIYEANGTTLSDSEYETMGGIVDELFDAQQDVQSLIKELSETSETNKIPAIEDRLEDARNRVSEATSKLNDFNTNFATTWGRLIGLIIQGNLLTPVSQLVNITANLATLPIMLADKTLGYGAEVLIRGIKKSMGREVDPSLATLPPSIPAAIHAAKQFGVGAREAYLSAIGRAIANDKFEYNMQLQLAPIKAFGMILANSDRLPDSVKNGTKLNEINFRAKKFLEAVGGGPANIMFRLLAFGDMPFYRLMEGYELHRIGKSLGLKGEELNRFLKYPNEEYKARAEKAGLRVTFQEDNQFATAINKSIAKASDILGERSTFLENAFRVMVRMHIPYIKTPANILSQSIQLAHPVMPLLSLVLKKTIRGGKKVSDRELSELLAKSFISWLLYKTTQKLMEDGLITTPIDADGKKERDMKYSTAPPNSINISGIKRLINGEDPTLQADDVWFNYQKLGLGGAVIAAQAVGIKAVMRDAQMDAKVLNRSDNFMDFISDITGVVPGVLGSMMDQSFLTGIDGVIKLLADPNERQLTKYLDNIMRAGFSVVLPNSLSAFYRSGREYLPDYRDPNPGIDNSMENILRDKTFNFFGLGESVVPRVNIWGESITQTPEGGGSLFFDSDKEYPWLYNTFGVFKSRISSKDPVKIDIYNLFKETGDTDVIPGYPSAVGKLKILLTKQESAYYGLNVNEPNYISIMPKDAHAMMKSFGQARYKDVKRLVTSPAYQKMNNSQKISALKSIYNRHSRGTYTGGVYPWRAYRDGIVRNYFLDLEDN